MRHSDESVLIIGMSCLFLLACFSGVFSPEAGGVLPAELSDDLFSTEHLRFRRPKLPGPGSGLFAGRMVSVLGLAWSGSGCGSTDLEGEESDSCNKNEIFDYPRIVGTCLLINR